MKIQCFFRANTVVFEANAVVFWANVMVVGADKLVFWGKYSDSLGK